MAYRPACHETGEPTPRAPRFFDEGRSCGNATSPYLWHELLKVEPGCEGCSRAARARSLFWPVNLEERTNHEDAPQ